MNLKKILKEWLDFWHSLDYGPKGAFVGLVLAAGYFVVPWIFKLLLGIIIIAVVMLLGALVGEIMGWFIRLLKKKKKSK